MATMSDRPGNSSTVRTVSEDGFWDMLAGRPVRWALAAARLGVPVLMIGRVSDDGGGSVPSFLRAQGVDCAGLKVVPERDLILTCEDIAGAEDLISQSAICLLPTGLTKPVLEQAVRLCHGKDVETLVVADSPRMGCAPLTPFRADVLCCDEEQGGQLTGLSPSKSPRAVAAVLAKLGFRSVVLRLGDRGAYVLSPEGESAVPGFAARSVDQTAAGDVFIAALAVARVWGWGLHEAIRFANAAGAVTSMRVARLTALPGRDDIEAFLAGQL